MFCVYLNQVINKNLFTTKSCSGFDVTENQKYYYSYPIYRKFD